MLPKTIQKLKDLGITQLHAGSNNLTNVGAGMVYLNGALHATQEPKSLMCKMVDVDVAKHGNSNRNNKTKTKQILLYEKVADKLEAA